MAGDYSKFAEYIATQIDRDMITSLNKEIYKEKYDNKGNEILDKIDNVFEKAWNKDERRGRGSVNQQIARKENFEKFLKQNIFNPVGKGEIVDLGLSRKNQDLINDLMGRYYEQSRAFGITKKPSKKVEKTTKFVEGTPEEYREEILDYVNKKAKLGLIQTNAKGKELTEEYIKNMKPKELEKQWREIKKITTANWAFVQSQEKTIKQLKRAGANSLPDMINLREAYRKMIFLPKQEQPIPAEKIKSLYDKTDEFISEYEKILNQNPKTEKEYKKALSNVLGINQKALKGLPLSDLKDRWDRWKELDIKSKGFIATESSLPDDLGQIKQKYKELSKDSKFKQKWNEARKIVEKEHSGYDPGFIEDPEKFGESLYTRDILNSETNRKLAEQLGEERTVDQELEDSFKNQYKPGKKYLDFNDRLELATLSKPKIKKMLEKDNKQLPKEAIDYWKKFGEASKILREKKILDQKKKNEDKRKYQLFQQSIKIIDKYREAVVPEVTTYRDEETGKIRQKTIKTKVQKPKRIQLDGTKKELQEFIGEELQPREIEDILLGENFDEILLGL